MPSVRSDGHTKRKDGSRASAGSQPAARSLLVLATVALVAVLGYVVLRERGGDARTEELVLPADAPASSSKRSAGEKDHRHTRSALGRGWEARGRRTSARHDSTVARDLPARRDVLAESPEEEFERLLQVRLEDGSLTRERADQIRRTVGELSRQGGEGPAAMDELQRRLASGELDGLDDDFSAQLAGRDPGAGAEPPPEGVRPLLERLAGTTDPVEVAMLAQELEDTAPGVYREEVLHAARQALARAAQDPPEQRGDVTPLFEVFEAYGGDRTAKELEQETSWWPYSLMALAGMPDGRGVPGLVATASNPGIPVEQRPQIAFQMLAQAAADSPEAGEALVDLARTGQIPERAWGAVGAALQGMHLRFPLQIFDAGGGQGLAPGDAPRIGGFESENRGVHYDLRLVSPTWSQDQIDRQIDLIDALSDATGSSDAKGALDDARSALLGGG